MKRQINPKLAKYSMDDKKRLERELIYLKLEIPTALRIAMIKLVESKLVV